MRKLLLICMVLFPIMSIPCVAQTQDSIKEKKSRAIPYKSRRFAKKGNSYYYIVNGDTVHEKLTKGDKVYTIVKGDTVSWEWDIGTPQYYASKHLYDSLSNMSLNNLKNLAGQTLLLNSSKGAENSYRQSLYDKPNPGVFDKEVDFRTYYRHHFYVKSVQDAYVELIDTTLHKTLYFLPKYNDECYGKFLVVGYYEKMKKEFIGKSFYFLSDETSKNYKKIPAMTIFKCTAVFPSANPFIAFELGNHFLLKATVENPKYGELTVNLISRPPKSNTLSEFISVKDYNRLVKKYGKVNGRKVAEHTISIGMTKSMVLDSWGDPDKINVTSQRAGSEQWIYGNHYLYFINGKLVDRQVF